MQRDTSTYQQLVGDQCAAFEHSAMFVEFDAHASKNHDLGVGQLNGGMPTQHSLFCQLALHHQMWEIPIAIHCGRRRRKHHQKK
jgi:hypothetical protein